jgi:hypothetical protein
MLEASAKGILAGVEVLVADGYRKNAAEITELIKGLAVDDKFLDLYFRSVIGKAPLIEMIGAQCFFAFASKSYFARLNFWLAEATKPIPVGDRFGQYYSIGILHNHAFDFFTVGLLGPGYRSTFFKYDGEIGNHEEGDVLPLRREEDFFLEKGSSRFVPKSSVFHVQYEPKAYSLSLNIIPTMGDDVGAADGAQLIVDPENLTVVRKFYPELLDNGAAAKA